MADPLGESARRQPGPAVTLLDRIAEEEVGVGIHVVCELLAGAELATRPSVERQRVDELCADLRIVYPDQRFPPTYARLLAAPNRARQRISTMDLVIATAAVVDGASLVRRVPRSPVSSTAA